MDLWNLAIRFIYLSQTTVGILGNISLIFYYLVLYCRENTLKPTDRILIHMMAANALIILSTGVPQTIAVWGLKHFLNDFGCKLLLYLQGLGRSVSIGTTCLLSVCQALTISPRKSCWKNHKIKFEKITGCHISLIWILFILIFPYTFLNTDIKNMTRKRDFGFCSIVMLDGIGPSLYAALVVCPEIFFSVLMVWSSVSMIVILYRHKQRVQHIRSTHGSDRNSLESRVTQNILILVFIFLAFHTLSSILRGYIFLLYYHNWLLVNINRITSLCFPSFLPFVLLYRYSIIPKFCLSFLQKQNLGQSLVVWKPLKRHVVLIETPLATR
ncbi:vomeronasal type-1 receptor 4-like [Mesocricetus auratus]|uniref:Vomeronasal type-1 receptor n=1 Tax=Mesocricetus auratus TaxID=10036 RepID=A0ABM2WG74_MESAU|nr:vomeronasal type-1 receptor 4-like [Mesocricetus auratus]